MASCPEVRERIKVGVVRSAGCSVTAPSIGRLRDQLGLSDVSNTQFMRALGSLQYNYGFLKFKKHGDVNGDERTYSVSLSR